MSTRTAVTTIEHTTQPLDCRDSSGQHYLIPADTDVTVRRYESGLVVVVVDGRCYRMGYAR